MLSVMKSLKITVKEKLLNRHGPPNLICEAKANIKYRPIPKVSEEFNNLEALTPNHLFLLKVKPDLPPVIQYYKRMANLSIANGGRCTTSQMSSGNVCVKTK